MRKPTLVERRSMAAMPLLPAFFDIAGKCVVIAGGGEAAAWKAELVLAAGARLRILAAEPCRALAALAEAEEERATLLRRGWEERDFDGAAMAIGAFDDEAQALSFAAAARACGTPVNVVDRPQCCDFQFGSIINRAPVVVSVSTGGAAPALAQAIRTRIESVLPTALSDWAAAAGRLRPMIARRIASAKARMAFWRRFAEEAFRSPAQEIDSRIDRLLGEDHPNAGKVTIVGAGPGAAEHLTLKAVRALQSADVILFDDLVSDEVLDFARREAKRITVGKRGGRASCRQDDINATMLRLARQGKRVVRLKSGDPMIFGRAGEEIASLEEAGIAVEIVSGVTAALAAAARLKVSLTHRDFAQGVKFVTAHSRKGALPDLDWGSSADPSVTLMVYMGARMAPALAARLMAEGLDGATPVVIASAISRGSERFDIATLADLPLTTISSGEPVLIGVGRVFAAARAESAEAPLILPAPEAARVAGERRRPGAA